MTCVRYCTNTSKQPALRLHLDSPQAVTLNNVTTVITVRCIWSTARRSQDDPLHGCTFGTHDNNLESHLHVIEAERQDRLPSQHSRHSLQVSAVIRCCDFHLGRLAGAYIGQHTAGVLQQAGMLCSIPTAPDQVMSATVGQRTVCLVQQVMQHLVSSTMLATYLLCG